MMMEHGSRTCQSPQVGAPVTRQDAWPVAERHRKTGRVLGSNAWSAYARSRGGCQACRGCQVGRDEWDAGLCRLCPWFTWSRASLAVSGKGSVSMSGAPFTCVVLTIANVLNRQGGASVAPDVDGICWLAPELLRAGPVRPLRGAGAGARRCGQALCLPRGSRSDPLMAPPVTRRTGPSPTGSCGEAPRNLDETVRIV